MNTSSFKAKGPKSSLIFLASFLIFTLLLVSSMAETIASSSSFSYQQTNAKAAIRILSPPSSNLSKDPIIEYPIPTPNAGPNAVVTGPNDTLWFVEFAAGKIGEFFIQNDSFLEFPIPEVNATPASLAVDHFGNVWFSDQQGSGRIWMLNPSTGEFKQYPTLTQNSYPLFIVFDNQNNVWFTEITGNKIGELTYPNYEMTEYTPPTPSSGPTEMAYQENASTLWITQTYSGQLASFNITSHSFQEFNPSVSMNNPVGIVLDKNQDVWISEHRGSSIIQFNPSTSVWKKFLTSVPSPNAPYPISAPATLAIDTHENLWFVEHFSNKIGRLDPTTGTLQEFNIPNSDAYSVLNAVDSNGNFWFTQFAANALGFVPANATSPISVQVEGLGPNNSTINAGGSMTVNLQITNNGERVRLIQLNASNSFSSTGYTPAGEVEFNQNTITLDNGSTASLTSVITPPGSLSSGTYSIGFVFSSDNYSTVQTIFIQFNNPYGFLAMIGSYQSLPYLLIAAVAILGGLYFIVIRRASTRGGKSKEDKSLSPPGANSLI